MSAKLSIITVCYNNKTGLEKTINSVISQTYKNIEYIIIDGASTDGTLEIINKYKMHIDYWISESDNGIYNAMNKGIEVATGDYCYFLNSDDILATPLTVEKIFRMNDDADIIYGNLAIIKNGRVFKVHKYKEDIKLFDLYHDSVSIHHQASFIKRELFNKYGYYREDLKIISDWVFVFRILIEKNVYVKYVNIVFAKFLAGGVSSTGNNEKSIRNALLHQHLPNILIKEYESRSDKRIINNISLINKTNQWFNFLKAKVFSEI